MLTYSGFTSRSTMITRRMTFAAVAGILALQAGTVVLYDNLAAAPLSYNLINTNGPIAESFSTGSVPVTLTDVKLVLALPDLRGSAAAHPSMRRAASAAKPRAGTDTLTVFLYSDSDNHPGTMVARLGSITDSALTTTAAIYDFPVATPVPLAANTRYWITVRVTSSSLAEWVGGTRIVGTGVATEFNTDYGLVYANSASTGPLPLIMQVTATGAAVGPSVAPIPPSLLLALTALACVALYLIRRNLAGRRAVMGDDC